MFSAIKQKIGFLLVFFRKQKNKRTIILGLSLALIISISWTSRTLAADTTFAETTLNGVVDWMSKILLWISQLFIQMSIFFLKFVIELASYNGYLDSQAVNLGWVMIRDVTNMFFVVILLLIAFGTILGIEQYEWKRLLVKFIMAAIFVNFSRIICGVIIDAAQVVMITFVNGVAATAGGNLINAFGMDNLLGMARDADSQKINSSSVFIGAVAALVFSGILMVMMAVYVFMLLARMVKLWVYIVMSPVAFVASVIPQTQNFANQWWKEFGNYVISGPLVIFFIWLSFVTLGTGTVHQEISGTEGVIKMTEETITSDTSGVSTGGNSASAGIGAAMTWENMASFFIGIAMLMVGAQTAQSLGVTGGAALGKAVDFGKKVGTIASGYAAGRWLYEKGAVGTKAGLNMLPLVGAKARESYKERIKGAGLTLGTKWNEQIMGGKGAGFLRKNLQFGRTGKLIEELKRQNVVRAGQMGSATALETVKERTDVMEQGQELRKEKSELKRRETREKTREELLTSEVIPPGAKMSFGQELATRREKIKTMQRKNSGIETGLAIRFYEDKENAGKYAEAIVGESTLLTTLGEVQKGIRTGYETTESAGARAALEVEQRKEGEGEEKPSVDALREEKKRLEESLSAFERTEALESFNNQVNTGGTLKIPDFMKEQLIGKISEKISQNDIKIEKKNDESALEENESLQLALDQIKAGSDVQFDNAAVQKVAKEVADAGITEAERNIPKDFDAGQAPKSVDAIDGRILEANTAALEKLAKGNNTLRLAYEKVKNEQAALSGEQESGMLSEKVKQMAVGDKLGYDVPQTSFSDVVSKIMNNFKGMERGPMLKAFENATGRIVKKLKSLSDKTGRDNWRNSPEGMEAQRHAMAILAQLQKTAFIDDETKVVADSIQKFMSDASASDEVQKEIAGLANELAKGAKKFSGGGGGAGGSNASSKLSVAFNNQGAYNHGNLKEILKGIISGIGGVDKIEESPQIFNQKVQEQLRKIGETDSNLKNLGVNREQVAGWLRDSIDDPIFKNNLKAFIRG